METNEEIALDGEEEPDDSINLEEMDEESLAAHKKAMAKATRKRKPKDDAKAPARKKQKPRKVEVPTSFDADNNEEEKKPKSRKKKEPETSLGYTPMRFMSSQSDDTSVLEALLLPSNELVQALAHDLEYGIRVRDSASVLAIVDTLWDKPCMFSSHTIKLEDGPLAVLSALMRSLFKYRLLHPSFAILHVLAVVARESVFGWQVIRSEAKECARHIALLACTLSICERLKAVPSGNIDCKRVVRFLVCGVHNSYFAVCPQRTRTWCRSWTTSNARSFSACSTLCLTRSSTTSP